MIADLFLASSCPANGYQSGFAALMQHKWGAKVYESEVYGGLQKSTYTRGQLIALIESLKGIRQASTITIHTSSEEIAKVLRGKSRELPYNNDLWKQIWQLLRSHSVIVALEPLSNDFISRATSRAALSQRARATDVDSGYKGSMARTPDYWAYD